MSETKQKFINDLRESGQRDMANWVEKETNPETLSLLNSAFEGKHYLVLCKNCGQVFIDLPFKEFYAKHTHPEWDLWFCDAVIHWAEKQGDHSIYCFSDQRNYNISNALAVDCRNSSYVKVKKDVITHRKTLTNKKGKI